MRTCSHPCFCPPVHEGEVFNFEDEQGDSIQLEFLGLVLHNNCRYGFFVPANESCEEGSAHEAAVQGASNPAVETNPAVEVIVLQVTALDSEGQPESFELVDDEAIAQEVYAVFQEATASMYDFE